MEMQELFYKDVYATEFEAVVLSCEEGKKGYEIMLSDTLFYPEGGGQPADHGTIAELGGEEVHVLDVQRLKDDTIIHRTDGPLMIGSTVHGVIDWARRFDHMQNHSGEHIVSGLVHQYYGYENVGYHMGDVITIDLSGPLTWEQLMEIEAEANIRVYANLPIEISYPTEDELARIPYRSKKELTGRVRIVTIPATDICACCGTHVARTGEIGIIKFFSLMNYKGGVRIEMASGMKALRLLEQRTDTVNTFSRKLAMSPDRVLEGYDKVKEESLAKSRRITELANMYFEAKADALQGKAQLVTEIEENLSPVETRRFCELLLEKDKAVVAAVLSRQEAGWYYVIGSRTVDVRPLCKEACARLKGRGGGQAGMVQGTMAAQADEIRTALEELTAGLA